MTLLRVWTKRRPWWGFGFVQRWDELVMEPPPDADREAVEEMANGLRATGAGCRIEWS